MFRQESALEEQHDAKTTELVLLFFIISQHIYVICELHSRPVFMLTVCRRVHNDGSSFHGSGEACPACATCVNSPADRIFLCRVCVLMA